MAFVPMPEGVVVSHELPEWVKLAIADAVVVFGRVEQEAIEIAWLIGEVDLEKKLRIARVPAKDTLTAIVEAVENAAGDLKLHSIKDAITDLSGDRNLIVHGSWNMANEKPWVVWHKFIEDDDSVIGEYFEEWRFERFMKKATTLLETLRRYHDELERHTGIKTTGIPRA